MSRYTLMSVKDAIKVMGIDNTVANIDLNYIKKQYRKMALECHPDKCGGDSTRFHKLTEAYAILSVTPVEELNNNLSGTTNTLKDFEQIPDNIMELYNSIIKTPLPEIKYRLAVNINELHLKEKRVLLRGNTITVNVMQQHTVVTYENDVIHFTIVRGDISLHSDTVLSENTFVHTIKLISIEELNTFNRNIPFPDGSIKNITINNLFSLLLKYGDTLFIGESGVPYWYVHKKASTVDTTIPLHIKFTTL